MKNKILIASFAILFFISCNPGGKNPVNTVVTDTVNNSIDTVKALTDAALHNVPENVKQIQEKYYDITVDSKGAPEEISSGTSYLALYDKKGNILEEGYYDAGDSAMAKWVFQYDNSGLKINNTEYHKGELAFKGFFTYDNRNNLVTENYYLPDGRLSYSITNKYDNRKNKTECLIT
ncbi:MAG TPA: hypothetical protein VFJ43_03555, partial [Bacteroidia bacterium]|nr:hypothetical protein [Bacteroidia bacterium]